MKKKMMKVLSLLLVLLLLLLAGCSFRESVGNHKVYPTIEKPIEEPKLVVTVYADTKKGKGSPIDNNYVLTCYHTVRDSEVITVMNYGATVVYVNENRDIALLKTEHSFEEFYEIEENSSGRIEYLKNYSIGDSGMPILNSLGRQARMLVGQRTDGSIADVSLMGITKVKENLKREETETNSSNTLPDVTDNELFNSSGQ